MDYTGLYKIDMIHTFVPDGDSFAVKWVTPDEYIGIATDDDDRRERIQTMSCLLQIRDNNLCYTLMPIPEGVSEDEIKAAIEQGADIVDNKYICTGEPKPWEFRGEDLYIKSGSEGEVLGEKTDPWIKANQEDGSLIYGDIAQIKYVKA